MKLSVVIITKNEEFNIPRCIDSISSFADEIIVVDSFSTDATCEIAEQRGARVISRSWEGFGSQKIFAVSQSSNDWVLSLDADEVISPQLAKKIVDLKAKDFDSAQGFNLSFTSMFMGKRLRFGNTRSELHMRLFDRRIAKMSDNTVHEGFEVNSPRLLKGGDVLHYSYRNHHHYFDKFNTYTTLFAQSRVVKKRPIPRIQIAIRFPIAFVSVYIVRLGFLDGWPGFNAALLHSFYTFIKYSKADELFTTGNQR